MARPIGTGNISFGLVSIPCKLFPSAESAASIRFNMLDSEDNSRVKQQYYNPNTGEIVPRERMVKGYEFAKGQYVTFTDEELKELLEKSSPAIEITEFVPLSEVDPIYYDKAYYLGPETGGERAYKLLATAMRETERCALAKYAARGKQYLVLLRPYDGGLVMQQMHYQDEVKDFAEIPLGDAPEPREGELELAIQLIEQISSDTFDAGKYEDEVRGRIRALIEQKVEGHEVTEIEEEAPKAQIIDLMEALKASLGPAGEKGSGGRKSSKKAAGGSSSQGSTKKRASGGRRNSVSE
jgi:DNA end-binding protein Ku